jgi:hypothetical protein
VRAPGRAAACDATMNALHNATPWHTVWPLTADGQPSKTAGTAAFPGMRLFSSRVRALMDATNLRYYGRAEEAATLVAGRLHARTSAGISDGRVAQRSVYAGG